MRKFNLSHECSLTRCTHGFSIRILLVLFITRNAHFTPFPTLLLL
nr:MAG TPA: Protein of unknown function (DUF501) [Caudoviricetes sp.]